MRGHFARPAQLAASMRTDDALAVAYENRLAPQRCLPVEIVPAKKGNARAESVAAEADALFGQNGVGIRPETRTDINGCLVNHGVAFGVVLATPREDGTRVDFELRAWPIEYVRYDWNARCFKTRVDPTTTQPGDVPTEPELAAGSNVEIPIIHGDGRWVVFKKHELDPWTQEAAVLAGSLVWARHAYAVRDWAKGSVAHGNAKAVGALQAGVSLEKADGTPTPEAQAMIDALRSLVADDMPAVLKPAGSEIQFLTNNSNAWQVWLELVLNAEKAAARIYLGTDGTLGSQGGAPGVDIQALFGVAMTRVEGDLRCIERGIQTGVIEPWCAANFGDSTLVPSFHYVIPDADEDAERRLAAEQNEKFYAALSAAKALGAQLTSEFIGGLAKDYGVRAPTIEAPAQQPAVVAPPAAPPATPATNVARATLDLQLMRTAFRAELRDPATREVLRGPQGENGAPGERGAPGPQGEKGTDGAPGRDGVDGAAGPPGRDGVDGKDGAAGRDGVDGEDGKPIERTDAERNAAYLADIADHRANRLALTQARLDELARLHNVPPARLEKV